MISLLLHRLEAYEVLLFHPMKKLTSKVKRFCHEYLIDHNGTQAAIRAGYSKRSAKVIASENLTKPDVIFYLGKLMEAQARRVEIDADSILRGIAEAAQLAKQIDYKPVRDKDGEIVWTPTFLDNQTFLKSSELLGRNLKLFTDKIEHSGGINLTGKTKEELQEIIDS